jgi:hypothetical protein
MRPETGFWACKDAKTKDFANIFYKNVDKYLPFTMMLVEFADSKLD